MNAALETPDTGMSTADFARELALNERPYRIAAALAALLVLLTAAV